MAFVSCDNAMVYSHYEHTSLAGWEKADTLFFKVDSLKKGGQYREGMGVRINGDYPFTRLCLVVEQRALPSGFRRSDTLFCDLFDHDGAISGGSGVSLFQYEFRLPEVNLLKGDSLMLTVHHNMKRDILPGIADVGFWLEASD